MLGCYLLDISINSSMFGILLSLVLGNHTCSMLEKATML